MGKLIGIDLGTTNSCMFTLEGNVPTLIPNAEGERTTPSVVGFSKKGDILVGSVAKRQSAQNVDRTISSVKRYMGTNQRFNIDNNSYSPEEISSIILKKLKLDAEAFLGDSVTDVVITVPAYFNDAQRQATKLAGEIAGFNVKRIINEPTSAAVAYGLNNNKKQKILVYDFGGGTFDVSIIEMGDGVIEVLATNGNNCLGGDDIDQRLLQFFLCEIEKEFKISLKSDIVATQRLLEAAEKAKKELSSAYTTNINIPFLHMTDNGPIHFDYNLTRTNFNNIIKDLIEKTKEPIESALQDAGLKVKDIDKILLVGGSTRIPVVQDFVKSILKKDASRSINPDECVAMGAAMHGESIFNHTSTALLLLDVTPLSLSIELANGESDVMIKRNTTIPYKFSKIFSTAVDRQTNICVKVYQGERFLAKDNIYLGEFVLGGILPAKAGVPKIEVTFDINENGILTVYAKDLITKITNKVSIKSKNNLSQYEINKAIQNAKDYEKYDDLIKEFSIEANNIESYISNIKKSIENIQDNDIDKNKIYELLNQLDSNLKELKNKKITEGDLETIKNMRVDVEENIEFMVSGLYENNDHNSNFSDENRNFYSEF